MLAIRPNPRRIAPNPTVPPANRANHTVTSRRKVKNRAVRSYFRTLLVPLLANRCPAVAAMAQIVAADTRRHGEVAHRQEDEQRGSGHCAA